MAGVTDIRLAVAWRDHPKRKKLARRVGAEGVLALMDLWLWAGGSKPDGHLDMDAEDVELAANWDGEPGALVMALLEVGLLDATDGAYQLHDWQEHQRWAANAERRSEASRVANDARWRKKRSHGSEPESESDPNRTKSEAKTSEPESPVSVSVSASVTASASNLAAGAAAASTPPAPKRPRKAKAAPPEQAEIGVLTRLQATARIAAASGGRYVDSPPVVGALFKLDKHRHASPDGALFDRIGRWLAAGGDAYKGTLDGRHLADIDAWAAQATAWDGRSRIGKPPSPKGAPEPAHRADVLRPLSEVLDAIPGDNS